jgi:hypothetical protein
MIFGRCPGCVNLGLTASNFMPRRHETSDFIPRSNICTGAFCPRAFSGTHRPLILVCARLLESYHRLMPSPLSREPDPQSEACS